MSLTYHGIAAVASCCCGNTSLLDRNTRVTVVGDWSCHVSRSMCDVRNTKELCCCALRPCSPPGGLQEGVSPRHFSSARGLVRSPCIRMDTGERTHSQAAELGALVCVSLECVCSVSCAIAMAASLRPDGRPSQHYFFFMLFGVLLPVGFVSYNRAPFSHHSVMLAIAWCHHGRPPQESCVAHSFSLRRTRQSWAASAGVLRMTSLQSPVVTAVVQFSLNLNTRVTVVSDWSCHMYPG